MNTSTFMKVAACAAALGLSVPTAMAEETASPAMWRITDVDSEIYLFGTFHLLPASLKWTTPALDEAMARTPITMTEADTESPAVQSRLAELVRDLGLNPPGVSLSSQLGSERARQFALVSERFGIPMAALEPMKPWLAMISLAVGIMQTQGYSGEAGAEKTIGAKARAQNDKIAHLETAEFQIRALAGLSNEEWLADFERGLAQMADFEGFSQRTLDAWQSGDLQTIEEEMIGPMKRTAPGAYKTLFVDRNADWVVQIEKMLEGSGDYFIAAGAGHFIGEDGVVEILKEKGYAIERVQ